MTDKKVGAREVRFKAKHSGLYLNVSGQSKDDGGHLIQWNDEKGAANETFILTHNWDGTWHITAKHSGKTLTAESDSDGAKLIQSTDKGSPSQHWTFVPHADGSVSIVNAKSGKYVDVTGQSKDAGANVILWSSNGGDNQKWIPSRPLHGGLDGKSGHLISHFNKFALDINGQSQSNGAELIQWVKADQKNQVFNFHKHDDWSYYITAAHSSKYLTATKTDSGSHITQEDKTGKADQWWRVEPNEDGSYTIINVGAKKAINIPGFSKKQGEKLIIWDVGGGENEHWILE